MPSTPVALITGAARRLGAGIARKLHGEGFNVMIHYHHSGAEAGALCEQLNQLRSDSAMCRSADIAEPDACTELVAASVAWRDRLDVLVNNASSFAPTPIESITTAQWDNIMGSNLKGPLFLASAAARHLRERHGCIVNITDIHARHPLLAHPIYCAAKAGLESATRSLARDLAPEVRVNAVAPGAILWPENGSCADEKDEIIAGVELKRRGSEADIAKAVAYLVLDAPYVTGQILSVDGGRTLAP